jgi:PAS domain S-box-containing protein
MRFTDLADLIAETVPVGIVVTDSQGKIVLSNAQANAWLGYFPHELAGKSVDILVPQACEDARAAEGNESVARQLAKSLAAGQDCCARRKDGTEFPVDVSLHPVETEAGAYVVAHFQDASLRKQASIKRSALQTARLAAIGEAVSGLAHESRNALQRAQASLDLLEDLDRESGPDQALLIDRIRTALSDLKRNYEEVKNYAAPIVLSFQRTNLFELCEQAFAELMHIHRQATHRLQIECSRDLAVAKVDPNRMKQVFHNVLENSIMAAPQGAILVTSANAARMGNQPAIEFEIRDNGGGVDAQTALRMFEPFFTTKQHGIGLGLSICQRIIDAHDGSIRASNHPAGGTSIEFTLPRRM